MESLRLVLSGSPAATGSDGIGLYEWDAVKAELSWDRTLASVFGAERSAEPPIEVWQRRVHPDDRERVRATFNRLTQSEEVYRIVLDDGSVRYVLSRATHVLTGTDGTPTGLAGVMLDVTALRDAGVQVTAMLESISDGFAALDREFRFTYANREAERVLGTPRREMLGRVVWDVFPAALGTKFEVAYRRAMTEGTSETVEEFYPEPLNAWFEVRAQPSKEGLVVYFQDVTARKRQEQERERLLAAERQARLDADRARAESERMTRLLAHQATHDSLTGLLNRSEFERLAQRHLATPQHSSHQHDPITVLFLDLDRFKLVNDSLGHAAGDALLVQVAARLGRSLREQDVVARLGGDEFVVLLVGQTPIGAQDVAARLLAAVREPVLVSGRVVVPTASIGLAAGGEGSTVETLLRDADVALYRAKDAGRDRFAWFDARAHDELLQRLALESDLREALGRDGLRLEYQPVFALHPQQLVGVEALARWDHPTQGPVPPGVFVPLAEEAGLARPLGSLVLRMACTQAAAWLDVPEFRVWVNLSPAQLEQPGLADEVRLLLEQAGVAPDRLGVEVTESALADERCATVELTALARLGVAIAIDDFGTGYSSLARLNTLPLDVLKIDRSFVHDVERPSGLAAVNEIVQLAHALDITTIAEGIETPAQLELVRGAGSDAGVGYLLARPSRPEHLGLHHLAAARS